MEQFDFSVAEGCDTIQGYHVSRPLAVNALATMLEAEAGNPRADIVYYGTVQIPAKGEERTLVRFTLDGQGEVVNINTLPKTIVQRTGL